MKTLTNIQVSVIGGKLTITAEVVEVDKNQFRYPTQQVTVGYLNPINMKWPRHIQISGENLFVKAFGNGMVINHDDIIKIAAAVEPKTSFPPLFSKRLTDNLTADFVSELQPDFQWQVSDTAKEGSWMNIAGQISATLDKTKVQSKQYVRVIASSEAGSVMSNPVQIK